MNEREVKPFTIWKHFKGSIEVVLALVEHSEIGEILVVYRCTGNKGKTNHADGIYARPIKMFLSEVDSAKYPDVQQKYRFEQMEV